MNLIKKFLRRLFGQARASDSVAALNRLERTIAMNTDKLNELVAEVAETKAAVGPLVTALKDTQAANATLAEQLAAALEASDGEETNAKIQEAIDSLNDTQETLRAAIQAAPQTPVDQPQ